MKGWGGGRSRGGRSPDSVGRSLGFGRPIPGFGRPLLVADRGERGSGQRLRSRGFGGRGDHGRRLSPAERGESGSERCSRGFLDGPFADGGRPCGGPGWRGWEPPPHSLRDSSPSGDLRVISISPLPPLRGGRYRRQRGASGAASPDSRSSPPSLRDTATGREGRGGGTYAAGLPRERATVLKISSVGAGTVRSRVRTDR